MANPIPPHTGTAASAADLVRRGLVSSRELTAAMLDRIAERNKDINAVVQVRREAALAEAASADEAVARGEAVGPFHGVPMTVKEALHVAGLHSTWGNPDLPDSSPIETRPWYGGCERPVPSWSAPPTSQQCSATSPKRITTCMARRTIRGT
ncbi:amidase family protein [Fodinicola acaciae]|uniref:amidase family protein n=1 Tax=Fodinicola acaciae TaxID=2681555 RepID=UPI001FEA1F30|nr:amidase family protein [Fodinicola acaciae]